MGFKKLSGNLIQTKTPESCTNVLRGFFGAFDYAGPYSCAELMDLLIYDRFTQATVSSKLNHLVKMGELEIVPNHGVRGGNGYKATDKLRTVINS